MIVSLFFFLICFDPSASRASTRRSRSASEVVWSSVSVVVVALMSDRLPDHVPEAAVVEHIGVEQLVAADLGPARDVGTGAGVGREELEQVARARVLERPSEGDERPRARLTLGIDGARDDIHGCGTSKTLSGTRWCEMGASGGAVPLSAGTGADAVRDHGRDGADLARSNHCRCNILLADHREGQRPERRGYGTRTGSTRHPAGPPR